MFRGRLQTIICWCRNVIMTLWGEGGGVMLIHAMCFLAVGHLVDQTGLSDSSLEDENL